MTDLTQRQLHDKILRSLKETGKRMAAKYKDVDQPAPKPQRKRDGNGARRPASKSPGRS